MSTKNYRLGVEGMTDAFVRCTPDEIAGVVRAIRKRTRRRVYDRTWEVSLMPHECVWWMVRRWRTSHEVRYYSNGNGMYSPAVTPGQLASGEVPMARVRGWYVMASVERGAVALHVGCKRIPLDQAVRTVRELRARRGHVTPILCPSGTVIRLHGDRLICSTGEGMPAEEAVAVARVVDMAREVAEQHSKLKLT